MSQARYLQAGGSADANSALRRAYVVERAADPLHCARIDTKPLSLFGLKNGRGFVLAPAGYFPGGPSGRTHQRPRLSHCGGLERAVRQLLGIPLGQVSLDRADGSPVRRRIYLLLEDG